MTTILDGIKCSKEQLEFLREKTSNLNQKGKLVIFSIGENDSKEIYINKKVEIGNSLGVDVVVKKYKEDVSEELIIESIKDDNNNQDVKGIIVQMPIPDSFDTQKIIDEISPEKDIDGLTSYNLGLLLKGVPKVIPATTKGILTLLEKNNISLEGKKCVVIGRSILVGKPTLHALLNKDATVTICHSKTPNLPEIVRSADIIISATGHKELIKKDFVNNNQIIIDVGISRDGSESIKGDVSEDAKKAVKYSTPVPGGVGPMTVISLFENYFSLFKN